MKIKLEKSWNTNIIQYLFWNTPQFNTRTTPCSTWQIRESNTKKSSVQHTGQFKTKKRQFNTNLFGVFRVLSWRFLCVELTGVLNWCFFFFWTDGSWVVKRSGLFTLDWCISWCVELFFFKISIFIKYGPDLVSFDQYTAVRQFLFYP